jgi:hypothetical protein
MCRGRLAHFCMMSMCCGILIGMMRLYEMVYYVIYFMICVSWHGMMARASGLYFMACALSLLFFASYRW